MSGDVIPRGNEDSSRVEIIPKRNIHVAGHPLEDIGVVCKTEENSVSFAEEGAGQKWGHGNGVSGVSECNDAIGVDLQ